MYLVFINPNLVRIYGYSSRNQQNKQAYIDLLAMRIKAKHKELSDDFLKPLNLTNDDLKIGLKLPLNAYTGTLRASFNQLFDNLQGFSICSTGQMLLLQLVYDLKQVPTVEICSCNTDAVAYMIDEEYVEEAHKVLQDWQDLTGLELEQDKIVKLIMRDVNNYCEIVQVGDNDYEVHYKGGELTRGEHKFKWNKDKKCFEYSFKNSLKSNSMSVVSEAILKELLFNIPVEETINNCNDIFRFQMISHLGHTYEKCVQETPNGDIELQRNNRIYAGLKPSGMIIKVKTDGRRDSLANCPENPVVDNANELTIDDINKEWYIKIAKQRVNDFLGVKRMEEYKKDELVEIATNMGLDFDKRIKKEDLIKLIENNKEKESEKSMEKSISLNEYQNDYSKLLKKINQFRQEVQQHDFVLDKALTDNLGGGEYSSIGQFYNFTQQTCLKLGLDFSFESMEQLRFEREIIKPSVGSPRHLSEVVCRATFTDIDTGCSKSYSMFGSGADTIDKATGIAETMAFRNWFKFNFTPKEKFDWEDETTETEVTESKEVKVPTYVPPVVKEEIKEKVVATEQHEAFDKDDSDKIADMIMQIRAAKKDDNYGEEALNLLQKGLLQTAEIDAIRVKLENIYVDTFGHEYK